MALVQILIMMKTKMAKRKPEKRAAKMAAFESLKAGFEARVIPVLQEVEFERSVFSSHHFGGDNREPTYTFISLQEKDLLDLIYFQIRSDELCIKVYYNRIKFSDGPRRVDEFQGRTGLSLLLMPVRKTEKEIHRWLPIPFLKIPRSYVVTDVRSVKAAEEASEKTIAELCGDLMNFDIIRAEWDAEHDPVEVEFATLA